MIDFIVNLLCSCCCSASVATARGASCCETVGACFIYYKLYQCCSYISTQISKCCTWSSNKINSCNNFVHQKYEECIGTTHNNASQNSNIIYSDEGSNNSALANNNIPVAIMVDNLTTNPFTNASNISLAGSLPTNSEQLNADNW